MNAWNGLASIVLIACIALPVANSLWIPVPRNTNRIPQLVRTVKLPPKQQPHGPAPYPVAMKRDSEQEAPITSAETPGSTGAAVAYAVESPALSDEEQQQERQPVAAVVTEGDGQEYDDIESHWPITPRACLVLMKILHAQTAEIMEQGQTDADFYEAASYYQPAIRTLAKCMDIADRGYQSILLD